MADHPLLPVTGWGFVELNGGEVLVVAVDVSAQPEVADLPRASEGHEQVVSGTRWYGLNHGASGQLVLVVGLSRPVQLVFRLLFELPEHRDLVLAIIAADYCWITPGLIAEDGAWDADRALWLSLPDWQDTVRKTVERLDCRRA